MSLVWGTVPRLPPSQTRLFNEEEMNHPFKATVSTSREAYEHVKQTSQESHIKLYLRLLREIGRPSTDREVAAHGNVKETIIEKRRNDLMHMGIVVDCGIRVCKVTGRKAHIWYFVD